MKGPEIVLIAALSENRVLADGDEMPWHLPEDLQRFRRLTTGHAVLMGHTTYEVMGKPLAGRRNVVLSGRNVSLPEGVELYKSIDEALAAMQDEQMIWVIGGGKVYEQFLETADRMELTHVEGNLEGDVFFPPYEHLVSTRYEIRQVEKRNGYSFVTYVRKPGERRL